MGNKVTFDYSKASCFVSEAEVASMEKLVAAAKEELVSRSGAGNDFLGLTFRSHMTKRSSHGSRRRQRRSRATVRCFW